MKWSNVKWIFLRELRDQLRDRRTLFTIAVLPVVLYPLLGMGFLQVAQFSRDHATPVLIVGADSLPATPPLFDDQQFSSAFCSEREARLLELTVRNHDGTVDETRMKEAAENAIRSGQYAALVYFPKDFAVKLDAFRAELLALSKSGDAPIEPTPEAWRIPEPEIFVNTANDKSRIARDRVESVLRRWRESIVQENLLRSHVPVAATAPFEVVNTDISLERTRRAAIWSKILPFVVLIWALTGAFYPAIDLCAGEKERGTLETLLCSPAERSEIVWGKLLTIITFSMVTSLLNLLSMALTGMFIVAQINHLGPETASIAIGVPPLSSIGWIVITLLPISAMFSALSLAIAAFARSSKEGQYYLMPLLLVTLPLMMLPMLPAAELDLGTSLIPVTGMMLLLRALIEAQYFEALRFALPVIGTTSLCCLIAVRWAIDQFNNESVLFRESERWSMSDWLRHVVRDRRQTPTISEAICCGALLLMIRFFASFLVGTPDSWNSFAASTVLALVGLIAVPAVLMALLLTKNPRKTLLLTMPRPAALSMAVMLAVVIHPLGFALGEGVRALYPFSSEVMDQLKVVSSMIGEAPGLWAILLVLAVVPAICEELAFRGFILSGFRHWGHRWGAIIASSIFFGAAHGILQQSLTAFAVGTVIGYIAVQTGSLLPGILFHLVYNSMSLVMAMVVPELVAQFPVLEWIYALGTEGLSYRWPMMGISLCLTAAILSWFRSLPYEVSAEEALQDALDHQSIQPATKSVQPAAK